MTVPQDGTTMNDPATPEPPQGTHVWTVVDGMPCCYRCGCLKQAVYMRMGCPTRQRADGTWTYSNAEVSP